MRIIVLILATCILSSCSKQANLKGFDAETWKTDTDGCNNSRLALIDTLVAQKEVLKGLNQNQITDLLGKADQHELYERSQKFFIYHLEAGNNCAHKPNKYFKAFYIRFNSLGQAVAFTIQEIK